MGQYQYIRVSKSTAVFVLTAVYSQILEKYWQILPVSTSTCGSTCKGFYSASNHKLIVFENSKNKQVSVCLLYECEGSRVCCYNTVIMCCLNWMFEKFTYVFWPPFNEEFPVYCNFITSSLCCGVRRNVRNKSPWSVYGFIAFHNRRKTARKTPVSWVATRA